MSLKFYRFLWRGNNVYTRLGFVSVCPPFQDLVKFTTFVWRTTRMLTLHINVSYRTAERRLKAVTELPWSQRFSRAPFAPSAPPTARKPLRPGYDRTHKEKKYRCVINLHFVHVKGSSNLLTNTESHFKQWGTIWPAWRQFNCKRRWTISLCWQGGRFFVLFFLVWFVRQKDWTENITTEEPVQVVCFDG